MSYYDEQQSGGNMVSLLIVGIGICFFIMFMWYIFQPVTMTLIETTWGIGENQFEFENQYVENGVTILKFIVHWWGPLMVIAVTVLWFFVAAQGRDWRSSREGF